MVAANFSWSTVYPRVCGGTSATWGAGINENGSIPACAGEPLKGEAVPSSWTVGLSPRVRGNPTLTRFSSYRPSHWSIPACAGEPRTPQAGGVADSMGLSPRVRGNRFP